MRVKDFFYTIVISTITSLIVTGLLIGTGILQTSKPTQPTTYQIKQTVSNSLSGSYDADLKKYSVSETIHLQNVTNKAFSRILHFCLEFNETGISPKSVSLIDQETQKMVFQKTPTEYYSGNLIMDTSLRVDRPYYIYIWIESNDAFIFIYNATIVQVIYV